MLLVAKLSTLTGTVRLRGIFLAVACIVPAVAGTLAVDFYLYLKREARRPSAAATCPSNYMPMGSVLARGPVNEEFLNPPKFTPGEFPPDFSLNTPIGERRIRLADFRGQKPAVLLFGSFGCNLFCADLDRLNELRKAYQTKAEFLFICISDAGHAVLPPRKEPQPETPLARVQRGLRHFHMAMTCLLDGADRDAEKAFNCFPRRLIVVDRAGRVAMDLGKGLQVPWDLNALERWLKTDAAR